MDRTETSMYLLEKTNEQIVQNDSYRSLTFNLDYDLWHRDYDNISSLPQLTWSPLHLFKDRNEVGIPDSSGIYFFCVKHSLYDKLNSIPSYILYIGRAKNLNSRLRGYQNYINDREQVANQLKRLMILVWGDMLQFSYAPISDEAGREFTESFLVRSVHPPFNKDLFVKLKNRKRLY